MYSVLVADPPWQFSDKLGKRGADANYKLLDLDAIRSFPLPSLEQDAYLFLWRVSSMVEEAYSVVRAWGFTPKSEVVWNKLTKTGKPWFGMGRHVRASHETCIVATRGRAKPYVRNIRSTFAAPVPVDAEGNYIHSAKPNEFFEIVKTMTADRLRASIFERTYREGFDCFGDELPACPCPADEGIVLPPEHGPAEFHFYVDDGDFDLADDHIGGL